MLTTNNVECSALSNKLKTRNFKNFEVWKEGIIIVKNTYCLTKSFPKEERFGLESQMKRAAISIPSNIAERSSRNSDKAFRHFLEIAVGSLFELDMQLIVSKELNFIGEKDFSLLAELINKEQRKLISFINKLG